MHAAFRPTGDPPSTPSDRAALVFKRSCCLFLFWAESVAACQISRNSGGGIAMNEGRCTSASLRRAPPCTRTRGHGSPRGYWQHGRRGSMIAERTTRDGYTCVELCKAAEAARLCRSPSKTCMLTAPGERHRHCRFRCCLRPASYPRRLQPVVCVATARRQGTAVPLEALSRLPNEAGHPL